MLPGQRDKRYAQEGNETVKRLSLMSLGQCYQLLAFYVHNGTHDKRRTITVRLGVISLHVRWDGPHGLRPAPFVGNC
jgi:hypothetical protein